MQIDSSNVSIGGNNIYTDSGSIAHVGSSGVNAYAGNGDDNV